jgi:hypothetical protein
VSWRCLPSLPAQPPLPNLPLTEERPRHRERATGHGREEVHFRVVSAPQPHPPGHHMAALPPGGAHAAGAADPMQVDQPLPAAAAAAAHAPADAKVSGFFFTCPPPLACGSGGPERLRRPPGSLRSAAPHAFRLPRVVFGGSLVRSVRRSAPRRRASLGLAACPSRAISLVGRRRSVACRGGDALPSCSLRARYASFSPPVFARPLGFSMPAWGAFAYWCTR